MDIIEIKGNNIYAADDGKGVKVENLKTGDMEVMLSLVMATDIKPFMAHCIEILVKVGGTVKLGNSGNLTSPL